jgi:hypothetical protein
MGAFGGVIGLKWSEVFSELVRSVVETGIEPLDDLLQGGLPVGALSELRNVYRRMLQHHWSLSFFLAIGCAGFGPPVDDDVHLGHLTVLSACNKTCPCTILASGPLYSEELSWPLRLFPMRYGV